MYRIAEAAGMPKRTKSNPANSEPCPKATPRASSKRLLANARAARRCASASARSVSAARWRIKLASSRPTRFASSSPRRSAASAWSRSRSKAARRRRCSETVRSGRACSESKPRSARTAKWSDKQKPLPPAKCSRFPTKYAQPNTSPAKGDDRNPQLASWHNRRQPNTE